MLSRDRSASTRLLSHHVTIRLGTLIIFEALLFKLQPCRTHNLLAIVATSNGHHDRGRFQSGLLGKSAAYSMQH